MRPRSNPTSPHRWRGLLAILALGSCLGCGAGAEGQQHVLLISIDTLRADHLGLYGHDRDISPFLDRLAARGIVFDDHYSNSNTTLPSHASILTGLLTPAHGVRDDGSEDTRSAIPEAAVTLAERFGEAGYRTVAMTAHPAWLSPSFGFDKGFDTFETSWRDAPETIDNFLSWLDGERPTRSFAFLHFFDVHSRHYTDPPSRPYHGRDEFVERIAGDPPEGFTGCASVMRGARMACGSEYLQAINGGMVELSDEHLEYLRRLYESAIACLDARLEAFFEELDERGYLRDALVVVTSDHGESFLEHGVVLHSSHHPEVSRVPLIVVPPESLEARHRRFAVRTQSIDIAPTVLELAGLAPFGQGRSLAKAVLHGVEPEPSAVLFHENVLIARDEQGSFKLQRTSGLPVFYDHAEDPGEYENLMDRPGFAQENKQRLMAANKLLLELANTSLHIHAALGEARAGNAALSEDEAAKLRALGYF